MSTAYEHGTFSSAALVDLLTTELDGARRETELLRTTAASKEKEFRVALKALVDEQKARDAASSARNAELEKSLQDLKSRVASGEYGGVAARRVRELEEQCAEGERAMEAMHAALQKLLAAQKEGVRSSPLEAEKRAHRSDLLDLAIERSAHADAIASLEDQLRVQRRAYIEDVTQMARFVPDVKSLPFRVRTTLGMEWAMNDDAEIRPGGGGDEEGGSSDDDDDVHTVLSEDHAYSLESASREIDGIWPMVWSTAASAGFDYEIDNCTVPSDERYSLDSDLDRNQYTNHDTHLMRRGSRTETRRKENDATRMVPAAVVPSSAAVTTTAGVPPTSTSEEVGDKDFIQSMLKSAIDKYYAKKTRKNENGGPSSSSLPPLHDVVSPLISTLLAVVDGDEHGPGSRFDAQMSPSFFAATATTSAAHYQQGGAPSSATAFRTPAMVPGAQTPALDEIVTAVIETILKDDTTSRRFREKLRAHSTAARPNGDRGNDTASTPPSAVSTIDAVVASVVQRLSIASDVPPALPTTTIAAAPLPFSSRSMSRADDDRDREDDGELLGAEELPPPFPRPSVADVVEKALDFDADRKDGADDIDAISQPGSLRAALHDEPPPLPPSPSQQLPPASASAHDDSGGEGEEHQERRGSKPPPPIPEVLKERLRMSSLALQRAGSINIDVDDIDSSDSEDDDENDEDDNSDDNANQPSHESKADNDGDAMKLSDTAALSTDAEETKSRPEPQPTMKDEDAHASPAPSQELAPSIAEESELEKPMTRARKSTLRLGTALPGMANPAVAGLSPVREGQVDTASSASSSVAPTPSGGDSPSSSAIQPLAEQLTAGRNRMASRANSVLSPTTSLQCNDDERVVVVASEKKKSVVVVDSSIDTAASGVATNAPDQPVDQKSAQEQEKQEKQEEQEKQQVQQQSTVVGARQRSGSRLAIATPPRRALGAASKELMRKLNK